MKPRAYILIIVVVVTAAVAAGIAFRWNGAPEAGLLGEKFYDPQMKLTFHPPAGWKLAPPEPELRRILSKENSRLLAHFKGPKPGDSCSVLLFTSDDRRLFRLSRDETASRDPRVKIKTLEFSFDKINDVPAWINQYAGGSAPFVMHNVQVVLDRSDKKIMLLYAASVKSMRDQGAAVDASIRSLRLD